MVEVSKECSICHYCQYSPLHHGYVCENEDSPYYGVGIDDWLDSCCGSWANDEGVKTDD